MREKAKILIVDDSSMNRMILSDMLESEYEIIEAENGVQAISILQKQGTDISLVMLDMVMPEMDGFGVLEIMNKYKWINDIPVIMISVENSRSCVENAYALGVTDYINRPFDSITVHHRVINTIMLYDKQKKLVEIVADQVNQKERSNSLMISILSHIVEFRNGESGLHVLHIRIVTEMLLRRLAEKRKDLNLTKERISLIGMASALHDIGKIAVPENILNKPGRFTPEEYEIMKTHSALGAEMLSSLPFEQEELVKVAYEICRWHHERYDGRGYPDGLKGDEIPISAQIVSIADVYDALTSERVYKKAFSHEKAIEMIKNNECGVFNPLIIECLNDIADRLKTEMHTNFQSTINNSSEITAEILRKNKFKTSEHMFGVSEVEKIKNEFFKSVTNEIYFEYIAEPSVVTVSGNAAKRYGIDEDIINPFNNSKVLEVFQQELLMKLSDIVRSSTPSDSVRKFECVLIVDGKPVNHRFICRSMWSDDTEPAYVGVIGKVEAIE